MNDLFIFFCQISFHFSLLCIKEDLPQMNTNMHYANNIPETNYDWTQYVSQQHAYGAMNFGMSRMKNHQSYRYS